MIELVHYRDPDDECVHALFINGVKVPIDEVADIDPGRSESIAEWRETVKALRTTRRLSPSAREYAISVWEGLINE